MSRGAVMTDHCDVTVIRSGVRGHPDTAVPT